MLILISRADPSKLSKLKDGGLKLDLEYNVAFGPRKWQLAGK